MTTRAPGCALRIACSAVTPHISGMTMSMMVTSGRRASCCSTASRPLLASPTRRMSSWLAMASPKPVRSKGWSSTTSTLMGRGMSRVSMSASLTQLGVICRHPLVSLAAAAQVAQAGEGQVGRADQRAFLGGLGEGLLAGVGGALWIGVEADRYLRVVELDGAGVDQVTHHQQLLALAFNHVADEARRVAVAGDCADARRDVAGAIERLQVLVGDVGRQRRHRALEEALAVGLRLVHIGLAEPEVGVVLVGADGGVGEGGLAVGCE